MSVTPEVLKELARYDTPTICNTIELFEVRPNNQGYMDHRIRAEFPELPPMVGFAATASFRSDAPPGAGDAYGSLAATIETFADLPGPSVMVFQDLDDPPVSATFGEIMCSTYQNFGAAGLITSGAGRDLEQVRALGFPVFTSCTNCSHAFNQILDIGSPVRVGGLVVRQGDLLHGDANGVTNIPLDIADEVADVSKDFLDAENIILSYVKGDGEKTVGGFVERQNEFRSVIQKVRERVSRKS